MTMHELTAMNAVLHGYKAFAECVVKTIRWSDFHTTVAITLDYIWSDEGTIRDDNADRVMVTLVFRFVREFTLKNDLRPIHLEDPSQIGWGLNEVSNVTVEREENHPGPGIHAADFFRARLHFERATWIEVSFGNLEVKRAIVAAGDWE